MELARANASSGQVAKRQGSGTNNILWKGAPTSSADWQRKQGGQRCSACWKASSRTKAGTKLGRKSRFEKQKWSLFFLGVFFWIFFFFFPPFPHVPWSTPSPRLFSFEVVLQTNERLLTVSGSVISLPRLESQEVETGLNRWQNKTQRQPRLHKLRYFSPALVACLSHAKTGKPHKWHLHLCRGLQRSRKT